MEPGGGLKPASTRASPEVTPQQRLTVSNMLMQLSISGQCKQRAQDVTPRRRLIPAADQSEQWLLLVLLLLLTTYQSSVYKNIIKFKTRRNSPYRWPRVHQIHTHCLTCVCVQSEADNWRCSNSFQCAARSEAGSYMRSIKLEVGNPGLEIWAGIPPLSWSSLSKVQKSPLNQYQYLLTLQHPLCLTLIMLTCCTSRPSLTSQLTEVSSCFMSSLTYSSQYAFPFLSCVFVTR